MYCSLEICLLVTKAVLIFILVVGSLLHSSRKYAHSLIFSYVTELSSVLPYVDKKPCASALQLCVLKSVVKAVDFQPLAEVFLGLKVLVCHPFNCYFAVAITMSCAINMLKL